MLLGMARDGAFSSKNLVQRRHDQEIVGAAECGRGSRWDYRSRWLRPFLVPITIGRFGTRHFSGVVGMRDDRVRLFLATYGTAAGIESI